MKKIHLLLSAAAVLTVCFGFVSCSQNEFDADKGEPLPPGTFPLELNAHVDGLKSRANGKDDWKDGDEIGVRIGSDTEIGRYTLDSEGNIKIEDSKNPLHWKNTSNTTVKAWFPYEPQTDVSIADQSDFSDFSSIDFLTATEENQNYKNPVDLNFKHQMAKIRCYLRVGDWNALTSEELLDAVVTIHGFTSASFSEGELSGSNEGQIIPVKNRAIHEALVVPANMAGKELLTIDLTIGGKKKTYSYKPVDENANLRAGTFYDFDIYLKKDTMFVNTVTASWNGEDVNNESRPIPLNLYLDEDYLPDEACFSDNVQWDDNDGCYKVDGRTFTISLTLDYQGENFMKGFNVTEGVASVNRVRFQDKHVFTVKMNTDNVKLKYDDYVQKGDFLYANGKWRPDLIKSDTGENDDPEEEESDNKNYGYGYDYNGETWECIGVVFKAGPGDGDSVENYGGRLKTIHGYAVALHDASAPDEIGCWGGALDALDAEEELGLYPKYTDIYNGYTMTQKMLPIAEEYKSAEDWANEKIYWAFIKLKEFNETVILPESFSEWYIPSIGQLSDLYKMEVRRERLQMAGEDFLTSDIGIFPSHSTKYDTAGTKYWSSTQASREFAWIFRFVSGKASTSSKKGQIRYSYLHKGRLRAVLTF